MVSYLSFMGLFLNTSFKNYDMRPSWWISLVEIKAIAERAEFKVP
jgi:hypothetical protein